MSEACKLKLLICVKKSENYMIIFESRVYDNNVI